MESLGKPGYAKDGHWCDSQEEIKIDNVLYERAIPHKREPFYPGPIGWRWYRADWQILCCNKVILVEYWGLANVEDPDRRREYHEKMVKKKALLDLREDIELIEIYPDDENGLEKALTRITELLDHNPPDELLESLRSIKDDCEELSSKAVKVRGRPIGTRSYLVYNRKHRLSVESLRKEMALKSIRERLKEKFKEMLRERIEKLKANVCWKGEVIISRIEEVDWQIDDLNIKILLAEEPVLMWRSPISWFRRLSWLLGLVLGFSYTPWDEEQSSDTSPPRFTGK